VEDSSVVHRLVSAIEFGIAAPDGQIRLDDVMISTANSGPIGSATNRNIWARN
jgi:hypothetical protein